MINPIIEKAKSILGDISYGLDLAKNWSPDNFEMYYNYFSNDDKQVRLYSLLVFAAGLTNWRSESATIFQPYRDDWPTYCFSDYLKAFIPLQNKIQQEFPEIHNHIMLELFGLNKENKIQEIENLIEKEMLRNFQKMLQATDQSTIKYLAYDDLLKEVRTNK